MAVTDRRTFTCPWHSDPLLHNENLAHEMGNVLSCMQSVASLIKADLPSPERLDKLATILMNQSTKSQSVLTAYFEEMNVSIPSLRCIVVDDEVATAMLVSHLLQQDGHEVVAVCHSGGEMIDQSLQHRPDLILYDLGLPDIHGFEAIQSVLKSHVCCNIPMTAQKDPALVDYPTEDMAYGYIVKPADKNQIMSIVKIGYKRFLSTQAMYQEIEQANHKIQTVEDQKRVVQLIFQAKAKIIARFGYSEEETHVRLQKYAKMHEMPLEKLALRIIDGDHVPLDTVPLGAINLRTPAYKRA